MYLSIGIFALFVQYKIAGIIFPSDHLKGLTMIVGEPRPPYPLSCILRVFFGPKIVRKAERNPEYIGIPISSGKFR
jgi:hypothetical protein